ncbi:MAG: hypothetical protein ABIH42_06005, partial [Planctomycetota bacterium]
HNFTSEEEVIELPNDIKISRLTADEINKITDLCRDPFITDNESIRFNHDRFIIKTEIQYPIVINDRKKWEEITSAHFNDGKTPTQIAKNFFDNTILGIRCFKKSESYYSRLYIKSTNLNLFGYLFVNSGSCLSWPGNKCEIKRDKVNNLKNFLSIFSSEKNQKDIALQNAIRRLSYGIEKFRPEDKLIDFFIAFESLLLTFDTEKKGKGNKMGKRGGCFLRKAITDMKENKISDIIRKSYEEIRGSVIHGRKLPTDIKIKNESLLLANLAQSLEEMLRISIHNILEMKKDKRPTKDTGYWDDLFSERQQNK